MKTSRTLIASALCLGALAAHAAPNNGFGDTYPDFQPQGPSTLTRAAVEAQMMAARKAGTMTREGDGYDQPARMRHSMETRQDVEADLMNARKAGYVTPQGNGYEMPVPAETPR